MRWLAAHNIILATPEALWLLILLPLLIWYWVGYRRRRGTRIQLSSLEKLTHIPVSAKVKSRVILPVLLLFAFVFFVIALARPQKTNTVQTVDSEGIDIVISLDVSGSMLAEDFSPNRIEAAKRTAIRFVEHRPADRIGLVIFAGESFTQCPITIDHHVLIEQIRKVESGDMTDGTAIGMGLATAVDRLRNAKGKSKVVILMTDGVNNTGKLDPQTALEIAKALHIRVYTIGVGTRGKALYPIPTPFGIQKQLQPVEIDEDLLKKIAQETGGAYFRATNNRSLEKIYHDIDQLEKTKIEIQSFQHTSELYFPFALAAACCILLYLVLKYTYYRSLTPE